LINVNGEVIGINSVKYASDEVEGMGYAIPISKATSIINELMTREILSKEDQGYLGIMGNDVTEDVASYYNMPIGVFINEVSADGAAEKAGLMSGDIITKIDKIEITSISQLREYVTSKRVGTEVTVTYMRKSASEYKEAKTTVSLQKNPNLEDSQQ
jgi:serine protease Do